MWTSSVIKKHKKEQSLNGRKVAHSGHPARQKKRKKETLFR
jgi:hypothetical protein